MSGAEKRWRQGEAWVGRDRVVWEGEEQVGIFLTAEIAASVVADHNARLDAEPVKWEWKLNGNRGGMVSGWMSCGSAEIDKYRNNNACDVRPLYTHPPDATTELATLRADIARVTTERDDVRDSLHYANGVADLAMKHRDIAEAALATAKLDAWIAGRDAAARLVISEEEVSDEDLGTVVVSRWDEGGEIFEAISSLIPPAEAEGGRQDD